MSQPETPLEQDTFSARLLALLDHAYDAAENPNGFDDLFTVADSFFFPRSAIAGLADDMDQAQAVSAGMDGHLKRLQSLIDRSEVEMAGGRRVSGGPQLANMVISADGARIVGNAAAGQLLGADFPVALDQLALMPLSRETLRNCLSDLRKGHFEGSTVIPFQHMDQAKPYLAKCTKLQSRNADGSITRGLSITVNHVDWRDDTLSYAAGTFGLTPAETDLLACLLDGMTYMQAADALDKSRETLKVQAKSILRKSGAPQMSDMVHLMMSYAFLAEPTAQDAGLDATRFHTQGDHDLIGADGGRHIQVNRYGQRGGRPLIFFHGLYQGPYLTDALNQGFHDAGFEVFAPSRPGFNRSDPPLKWDQFNQTVTDDVLAVCAHYGVGQMDFIVHHAGISFACRAGGALVGRVGSAVMVGAGVPIKDYMLKTMNTEARVAGAAVKYAPKLLDMLLRLGIAKWRRQGAYAYLNNLLPEGAPDRETLNDPLTGPVMEKGILHMISQGSQTIIHDGMSAMGDWEPVYPLLPARQLWLHGAHDSVMNHKFVEEFLAAKGQPAPVIYPDRGGDVLLGASQDVLERIQNFLTA
ncbi:alpha/beta fold hydrolase [Algirhabdus cladophorae]|uniref:alpha/beta fold hydrolase n=1 Tax=Algirhabdus cladophorae TaxID=3377108 RepID=UPI003B8465D5